MRFRAHYRRMMAGTSTVEHLQVLYMGLDANSVEVGVGDEYTLVDVDIQTFRQSGKGLTRSRERVPSKGASLKECAAIRNDQLTQEGWLLTYCSPLEGEVSDEGSLLVLIKADVDLPEVIRTQFGSSPEIGFPVEEDSIVYVEGHVLRFKRSRRKPGETRELRFDTVAAKVPADSLAAQLMAALSMKYAGDFSHIDGSKADPRPHAAKLLDIEAFASGIEALGIPLRKLAPLRLVRPWGEEVIPAVF